jgi:lactate permease
MLIFKFLMAILPIISLIIALSGLKMPGYKACSIALVITIFLALFLWKLNVICIMTGVLEGILNALWPICIVIIAALFTYNLTLRTGAMDSIKKMLARVSRDKRILILIIGWGFGNFMEGMAGFGTAVAIPASILSVLGLNPFLTVIACLVANTTPTAFGSVGIPLVTLSAVTGVGGNALAANTAIIEAILFFISPFVMVCIIGGGIKALKGVFMVTLVASLSFAIPAYITATVLGPELPDIVGSICSMACIIVAAKIFNKKPQEEYYIEANNIQEAKTLSFGKAVQAWCPFILIFIMLMFTSTLCAPVHNAIAVFKTTTSVYAGQGGNKLTFSWINTPGVIIFIAAVIGGFTQGAKAPMMFDVLRSTLKSNWKTIVTICAVMATAKIMSYSGMISDIANLLVVATGGAYPLISPLIGSIGGFVTGSGTSTSVLFGGLQVETAQNLGLSTGWMGAANTLGAGIGKMISPQSIAIGASAIGKSGSESKILRSVFKYYICYIAISGIICFVGTLLFN